MLCGVLLLAGAAGITGYNIIEEKKADQAAAQTAEALAALIPDRTAADNSEVQTDAGNLTEENPAETTQTITLDGKAYIGLISIPAIGITLPVNSTWNYTLLMQAPCCYQGSVRDNDLIIAGHNFNRHFGLLKTLKSGDEVTFTDTDGYVCHYTVTEIDTLDGYDVDGMTSGDWDLTLFTCTIGGVNRVTVRCRKTADA